VTASARRLVGATVCVLCTAGPTREIIATAIRSHRAHPIVADNAAGIAGTTMRIKSVAWVVDMSHPECLAAIEAAMTARVPTVACAFVLPDSVARRRLNELGIDLVMAPDAATLGGALLGALARRDH
jgi:hypothetical protein